MMIMSLTNIVENPYSGRRSLYAVGCDMPGIVRPFNELDEVQVVNFRKWFSIEVS